MKGRHRREVHRPRSPGARQPALRRLRARRAGPGAQAGVVGEEGLAETDRKYLRFGAEFEQQLASQSEARTLEQSMAIGWTLLAGLPMSELTRLSDAQIAAHIASRK